MNKPLTVRFNWKGDLKRIGGSFIGTSPEFEMALCTVCFLAREGDGRIDRIELDDYDVIVKAHRFGANLLSTCYPINKWNKSANERTSPPSGSGEHDLACEQALLFGRVKRVSREHASERRTLEAPSSRVLARLTSLAQIGELARGPTRGSLAVFPPPPLYTRESLLAGYGPAEISIGYLDVLSKHVPVLVKFWLDLMIVKCNYYITGKLRYNQGELN